MSVNSPQVNLLPGELIPNGYLPPTHLSVNGTNPASAFPAKAGPHFTHHGGMEG